MQARILLAESDTEVRLVISRYLSHHGFDVVAVDSAVDCLAHLRHRKFHALVLDLEVNWGGGEGVLAVLRDERDVGRIPVVITSGVLGYRQLATRLIRPVVAARAKPVPPKLLLSILQRITGTSPVGLANEALQPSSSHMGIHMGPVA